MDETHTLGVELDNSCAGSLLECVENLRPLAVRGHQRLDCRPRECGGEE